MKLMSFFFTLNIPATAKVKLDVYVTTVTSQNSIKNAINAPSKTFNASDKNDEKLLYPNS